MPPPHARAVQRASAGSTSAAPSWSQRSQQQQRKRERKRQQRQRKRQQSLGSRGGPTTAAAAAASTQQEQEDEDDDEGSADENEVGETRLVASDAETASGSSSESSDPPRRGASTTSSSNGAGARRATTTSEGEPLRASTSSTADGGEPRSATTASASNGRGTTTQPRASGGVDDDEEESDGDEEGSEASARAPGVEEEDSDADGAPTTAAAAAPANGQPPPGLVAMKRRCDAMLKAKRAQIDRKQEWIEDHAEEAQRHRTWLERYTRVEGEIRELKTEWLALSEVNGSLLPSVEGLSSDGEDSDDILADSDDEIAASFVLGSSVVDTLANASLTSPRQRFGGWLRSLTAREAKALESVPAAVETAVAGEEWNEMEWARNSDRADKRLYAQGIVLERALLDTAVANFSDFNTALRKRWRRTFAAEAGVVSLYGPDDARKVCIGKRASERKVGTARKCPVCGNAVWGHFVSAKASRKADAFHVACAVWIAYADKFVPFAERRGA